LRNFPLDNFPFYLKNPEIFTVFSGQFVLRKSTPKPFGVSKCKVLSFVNILTNFLRRLSTVLFFALICFILRQITYE